MVIRLIVISTIEDTINDFLVDTACLGVLNLYFIVLIFNNITRIQGIDPFKHKTASRLKSRRLLSLRSTNSSVRWQSWFNSCSRGSSITL
jgi:hypothetical protein